MGSLGEEQQLFGEIRFQVPDESISAHDRALFSLPAKERVVDERVQLHDFRTSPDVVKGPEGLDVQGFTYINHQSALSGSDWYTGNNVEDVYLAEVAELVRRVTGAKMTVVNNVALRQKLVVKGEDPKFYYKRDDPMNKMMDSLPKDRTLVVGKEEEKSVEPVRGAHIDYSQKGLRQSVRYCRTDIKAAGQAALDAEDQGAEAPRYAAYSVWRPLTTVRRDPLAVCDSRSVDKAELKGLDYRAPSNINESGEYLIELVLGLPPKNPQNQKWYFMPEQKEDEVLFIKFADTASEKDPSISPGVLHASPKMEHNIEGDEPRRSIECRVFAFW